MSELNGNNTSLRLKTGLAEMLKGGVIMDVTDAGQAAIAEKAGAVAVMALERVPAQIRAEGGVARMASPKKIREIMDTVSIPVMAKCRIGHFAEAQILQELGVLDIRIRRNGYGRQIDSSIHEAATSLAGGPLEMVFIRAPRIMSTGKGVEVLAEVRINEGGDPVLVRQGKIMAATFHPELSRDTRVHQEFLKLVQNGQHSK